MLTHQKDNKSECVRNHFNDFFGGRMGLGNLEKKTPLSIFISFRSPAFAMKLEYALLFLDMELCGLNNTCFYP